MLPGDYKGRKDIPLYDGTMGYFPLAFREMARVSADGNEQHNSGEPLHWAREKSTDQINTAFRHLADYKSGNLFDGVSRVDGKPILHLAKTFWRIGAELQLLCEKLDAKLETPAEPVPSLGCSGLGCGNPACAYCNRFIRTAGDD
jgi:hypothetical protein